MDDADFSADCCCCCCDDSPGGVADIVTDACKSELVARETDEAEESLIMRGRQGSEAYGGIVSGDHLTDQNAGNPIWYSDLQGPTDRLVVRVNVYTRSGPRLLPERPGLYVRLARDKVRETTVRGGGEDILVHQ